MPTVFANGYVGGEGQELAYTDPLTGLGNLRRFHDKVERLISDRADDPAPFTVGILDLDGFRPINDLFGSKAGDDILVQVAMRLRGIDGRAVDRDAHRRRRIRLSLPAGLQRGGRGGEVPHAHRDPVGPLRCRRAHRATVGFGRLFAVPSRRRDDRRADPQGRDGALPGQAVRARPRRGLYARDGRGRQARHPHRAGPAPRGVGWRGRAAFPADRRSQDAPHGRLRDAGALDRPRSRIDFARRLHSDRRGARHHRPDVATGVAQGDRGGPRLAQGHVPVLQPVAVAARRPEHRPAHTGDPRPHPASIRAGWRSRSPRPA